MARTDLSIMTVPAYSQGGRWPYRISKCQALTPAALRRTSNASARRRWDVLGEIEADGADLVHGRLLEWSLTPPLWHAEAGRP